jgi:hypothetical protein
VNQADRQVWLFAPYADYFQFHIEDAEAESGDLADVWINAPGAWRIGIGCHFAGLATAR